MTPPDPQALAEAVAKAMQSNDRVFHALGMRRLEVGPGHAAITMTVREDMLNGHDICHGGMLFALADTAFAYAGNAYNHVAVSSGADVTFVNAAEPGETLTAVAEERSRRGRTGVYDVTVSGREGRLIALFRCRSHRLNSKIVSDLDAAGEPS